MEVTLEQHGGWSTPLTIGRPAAPRRVDTTALPPEQARELSRLLAAAEAEAEAEVNTAPAATSGPSRSAPEAMRYTVTVERSGQQIVLRQCGRQHAVSLRGPLGLVAAACRPAMTVGTGAGAKVPPAAPPLASASSGHSAAVGAVIGASAGRAPARRGAR